MFKPPDGTISPPLLETTEFPSTLTTLQSYSFLSANLFAKRKGSIADENAIREKSGIKIISIMVGKLWI